MSKVKVTRLCDAINLNNNELTSLDMRVLDEQGSMIYAKVMKHMEKFYIAQATIKSINTLDEWYYRGCGKCNKKITKRREPLLPFKM
ncbi:hypothetical protein ZWY2020_056669 [Hordeum vulgare]|nr:hypothetical protein ZWY2020_056669 [Hordeum vulgare]